MNCNQMITTGIENKVVNFISAYNKMELLHPTKAILAEILFTPNSTTNFDSGKFSPIFLLSRNILVSIYFVIFSLNFVKKLRIHYFNIAIFSGHLKKIP